MQIFPEVTLFNTDDGEKSIIDIELSDTESYITKRSSIIIAYSFAIGTFRVMKNKYSSRLPVGRIDDVGEFISQAIKYINFEGKHAS